MGLQETVDFVKEEFAVSISRQNVDYYAKQHAERIAAKKLEITDNLCQIPLANRFTRLLYLERIFKREMARKRHNDAKTTLKQIASEMRDSAGAAKTGEDEPESDNLTDALTATAEDVWTACEAEADE